jgi:hypothetical protein
MVWEAADSRSLDCSDVMDAGAAGAAGALMSPRPLRRTQAKKNPARFPARAHFLSFYFPILSAAIRVKSKNVRSPYSGQSRRAGELLVQRKELNAELCLQLGGASQGALQMGDGESNQCLPNGRAERWIVGPRKSPKSKSFVIFGFGHGLTLGG